MKHSLGKVWVLLCFICLPLITFLKAEDFSYTLDVDKKHPYVKEAVVLTLEVKQTNHNVVLLFDFDLEKNKDYKYQRVDIQEVATHHALQIRYTYLIYPLHSGEVKIHFKFKKRVTTEDSVAYSFSGDRDNVKGLVTKDYTIDLTSLILNVKPLAKMTDLVGNFTLEYKAKKQQAKPYEALPFNLTLKGKGYPPLLDNILPKDVNFTLFTEKPIAHTLATKQGTQSTVVYAMALSHYKDFTLPAISLNAFNPLTKKTYTLSVPSQHFKVIEVNATTLLDKVDAPPLLKENWDWLKTLLAYLVIFFLGYFTEKVLRWQKKPKYTKGLNPLIEKIKYAKNEKDLLQILMANNAKSFVPYIKMLEDSLYGNAKINLQKIKKEALNLL